MYPRVIWQYWETVGKKPAFIDGLHEIAKKNAGVEVILVTPETLPQYLPKIHPRIHQIAGIAHKADMIRSMLVKEHGGMWLDSDAVVLKKLDWIFDLLDKYEFVCFNDKGKLELRPDLPWGTPPMVRINCFASRPQGLIVSEWVRQQHAKFPRTKYRWQEVGSEILHPLCLWYKGRVKVLPFEQICPVTSHATQKFESTEIDASEILRDCHMVMLSNHSLRGRAPALSHMTIEEIACGNFLLSDIVRHAMNEAGMPISAMESISAMDRIKSGVNAAARAVSSLTPERKAKPEHEAEKVPAMAAEGAGAPPKSNFAAARAFVEFGLQQKEAGKRESASGPGSSLVTAEPCLKLLNEIVPEFGIKSILDLGCGDWNWMQNAAWRSDPTVRYEGWEAHEALVETLNTSFGNERTTFRVGDLTTENFPKVDLIICRDVFFHLPLHISEGVVKRIQANRGLFLSTSFLDEDSNTGIGRAYLKIQNWGFYRINLDIAPFDIKSRRIRTVVEPKGVHMGKARSVCLYDFRNA